MFGRKKKQEALAKEIKESVNNASDLIAAINTICEKVCDPNSVKLLERGFAERKHDNEEVTKTALILPFIKALGYDPHDHETVYPEALIDPANPNGKKVDFAVSQQGNVRFIVEAKAFTKSLDKADNGTLPLDQLSFYFEAFPDAEFAILTNGSEFRFYCEDAESVVMGSKNGKKHVMSTVPFMTLKLDDETTQYDERIEKLTAANYTSINAVDAVRIEREAFAADEIRKTISGLSADSDLLHALRKAVGCTASIDDATLLRLLKAELHAPQQSLPIEPPVVSQEASEDADNSVLTVELAANETEEEATTDSDIPTCSDITE